MTYKYFLIVFFLFTLLSCSTKDNDLREGFKNPPISARPQTWWHWINGNITKEGITKDLKEMHNKGIGGATIFNIWGSNYPKGRVVFGTEEWNYLFNHAVKEASRLGMELGFVNCDGWGTSGGPWIKPDDAMKQITFSKLDVKGPANFAAALPLPASIRNYYNDIAVFACPVIINDWEIQKSGVKITCSTEIKAPEKLTDGDFSDYCQLKSTDQIENQYLQFQFDKPFTASSLLLFSVFRYNPIQIEIQASADGIKFAAIDSFECKSYLHEIHFQETTANYFRIVFKTAQFSLASYFKELRIIECAFLQKNEVANGLPLVNQWEIKSGLWFNSDNPFLASDSSKNALAVPAENWIDLSSKLDSTGTLTWQVPEGNWKILRVGYTLTGAQNSPASNEGRGLDCDKLDKRGIEAQFAGYVDKRLENNLLSIGRGLDFTVIDSYEAGAQNWTQIIPEEFRKRRGYAIQPWLPVLIGETVNSVEESERFLWDYRRTLADMMAENYYGRMHELCNSRGIQFHSEAANPEGTPVCDPLSFSSKTDVPMCEFWSAPTPALNLNFDINYGPDGSFKDVISAAHIYNKPIVSAESFSCFVGNWQHHPNSMKAQADLVFCQGINRINFHSYAHQPDESFPGWQMNPWGIAQNRKATWWEMSPAWFNYLSRCQYLLQKGTYIADALIFTSEGAPSTLRKSYRKDPFTILPFGYNFDACNKDILSVAKVKNGKVILANGCAYSLLVLPDEKEMTIEFLELIGKLVNKGAVVYGPKPTHTPGLLNYAENEKKLSELSVLIWGNCDGKKVKEHGFGKGKVMYGMSLQEAFDLLKVKPDFSYSSASANSDIQFIHKRINNSEVYFISNQKDQAEELICTFRINGKAPEIWNPEDGSIAKHEAFRLTENSVQTTLRLESKGSFFVVFTDKAENQSQNMEKLATNAPSYSQEIVLNGKWDVSFEKKWNAPEKVEFDSLVALNKHSNMAIKYYSGITRYTKEFELDPAVFENDKHLVLELSELHDMASVKINGTDVGIVWLKPYRIEVTNNLKPGKNLLEIKVANSWANRIIGDLHLPKEKRVTWSNTLLQYSGWGDEKEIYTINSPLVESGLIGPVVIKSEISVKTKLSVQ